MAAIKIDSPLMSRNIVELFDIIESVSAELAEQRQAIVQLTDQLDDCDAAPSEIGELLASLRSSTDHCTRMLS